MLFEAALHRADAELTLGARPRFAADVAVDGIDEFLENLPFAVRFASNGANLRGNGAAIGLVTDPAAWQITLQDKGFTAQCGAGEAAATVRASPSDLLLFVYGRRRAGEPGVDVTGDQVLLAHWVEHSVM
jgi:hypothetical protein